VIAIIIGIVAASIALVLFYCWMRGDKLTRVLAFLMLAVPLGLLTAGLVHERHNTALSWLFALSGVGVAWLIASGPVHHKDHLRRRG
jgi:hypothetical protein